MYAIYTQTYIHIMRILEYKKYHLMSMLFYIPKGNRSNSTFQVFWDGFCFVFIYVYTCICVSNPM